MSSFVVNFILVPSPPLTAVLDAAVLCIYYLATPWYAVPCSFRGMNCFAWSCYSACEARASAFPARIKAPLVLLNSSMKVSGPLHCGTYFLKLLNRSFDRLWPHVRRRTSSFSLFTALFCWDSQCCNFLQSSFTHRPLTSSLLWTDPIVAPVSLHRSQSDSFGYFIYCSVFHLVFALLFDDDLIHVHSVTAGVVLSFIGGNTYDCTSNIFTHIYSSCSLFFLAWAIAAAVMHLTHLRTLRLVKHY